MPFFMVDDQLPANAKVRRLLDDNPTHGLAAVGLWTLAGATVQAGLTDGAVTEGDLARITLDRAKARRLAGILVRAGLWHAPGHACEACPDVAPGAYVFHDWFQLGYDPGEKVKTARARRKEMKDPRVIESVRARDGDACRYCGRTVDWKDRRSDKGGTYDHVIPGMARGADNIVVCCQKCNRLKAQRTPEQAGMTLRPPPDLAGYLAEDLAGKTDPGSGNGYPPTRARARARPGRDRAGTGEGVGGDGLPAGPAPEVATPDRFGSPHYGTAPPSWADPEDSTCADHGTPMPCRLCAAEHYEDQA